jgi:hypothetical protein
MILNKNVEIFIWLADRKEILLIPSYKNVTQSPFFVTGLDVMINLVSV